MRRIRSRRANLIVRRERQLHRRSAAVSQPAVPERLRKLRSRIDREESRLHRISHHIRIAAISMRARFLYVSAEIEAPKKSAELLKHLPAMSDRFQIVTNVRQLVFPMPDIVGTE